MCNRQWQKREEEREKLDNKKTGEECRLREEENTGRR
jgi:hypothetical protein